jgi:hypothetical protein
MIEKRGNIMTIQAKKIAQVTAEAQRLALIEQLCATRGTQYQGLKQYRSL